MQLGSPCRIEQVERVDHDALEVGVVGVDLGIDHRDQHVAALRSANAPAEREAWEARSGKERCVPPRCRLRSRLLRREYVVGLDRSDGAIGLQLANDLLDRTAVGNPPPEHRRAGELEPLRFDADETVAARQRLDLLRRRRAVDFDHHLFGHDEGLRAGSRARRDCHGEDNGCQRQAFEKQAVQAHGLSPGRLAKECPANTSPLRQLYAHVGITFTRAARQRVLTAGCNHRPGPSGLHAMGVSVHTDRR